MKCRCYMCGKFIREYESFNDGAKHACGDCAIKKIMKIHGVSYDYACRVLERIQVGNGKGW